MVNRFLMRTVRRAESVALLRPILRTAHRKVTARRRRAVDAARRVAREESERRAAERADAHRRLAALEEVGDSAGALALAAELSVRYPEGERIAITASRLACDWEQWDLAHAALDRLPAKIVARPAARMARAAIHQQREEHDEAIRIFDELVAAWPADGTVRSRRARALMDLGRFDEAEADIVAVEALGVDGIGLRIRLRDANFDSAGALELARQRVADRPDDPGVRLDLCSRFLRELEHEIDPLADAAELLEREVRYLVEHHPDHRRVVQLQVELAVRNGAVAEVEALLERLPADWRHRWVFAARSWLDVQRGRPIDVARSTWEQLERHHFVPQVRPCAPGELSYLSTSTIPTDADEIRVFTVVRNERWRLPWFLDYYRSIGVDRFFVVDNDSTDGTRELLLGEPDVHVFHTTESYSLGRSGMVWVNQLVADHGSVGWNMYVDVDEALVFPGVDELGLRGLTDYLDAEGHEVIAGHMLDMHASDVPPLDDDGFERDFIDRYRLFDPVYRTVPSIECPYFGVRGGVRRLLGSMPEQTKTPLFRGGRNIRMLASSHVVTPAVVSDVRCVLLHFKLAGDYRATFQTDVEANSRRPYCRRRHLGYLAALEQFDGDHPDLSSEITERYESWRTLHELGFISAPERFLRRLDP